MTPLTDVELFDVESRAVKAELDGVINATPVSPGVVRRLVAQVLALQHVARESGKTIEHLAEEKASLELLAVADQLPSDRSDFDDVGDFHEKFGLPNVTHHGPDPRWPEDALLKFRLNFILEEVKELFEACGMRVSTTVHAYFSKDRDLPSAADALVDIAYVTLGMAQVMRLPWPQLFTEVQRANMEKERSTVDHRFVDTGDTALRCGWSETGLEPPCTVPEWLHSKRGGRYDVLKPPGWRAPEIERVLREAGWEATGE